MNNELTLQQCIYYSETLEEYLSTLKAIKATRITLLIDGVQFYLGNTHYEIIENIVDDTYELNLLDGEVDNLCLLSGSLDEIISYFYT